MGNCNAKREKLINKLDADNDGYISVDEAKARFLKDGQISEQESQLFDVLLKLKDHRTDKLKKERFIQYFNLVEDMDGKETTEEKFGVLFKFLDTNGDGTLEKSEVEDVMKATDEWKFGGEDQEGLWGLWTLIEDDFKNLADANQGKVDIKGKNF